MPSFKLVKPTEPASLAELIASIVDNPHLHAKWLNMFSYLEYIGFRKIVKSQATEQVSLELLKHVLEEGRHAFRLKKLAVQVGGPAFDHYTDDTLLCREAASSYFQTLDRACAEKITCADESLKARLTYLYVTWLIEVRALEVYSVYHRALQGRDGAALIKGLLAEEEGHLASVASEIKRLDLNWQATQTELLTVESSLYQQFIRALSQELSQTTETESESESVYGDGVSI